MLENMRISRLAVHEIFQRTPSRHVIPPTYAASLENLSTDALDTVRQRSSSALADGSKSLEMAIFKYGADSFLADADALMSANDTDFLKRSRSVPDRLANAQMTPTLPGGIVIVFDGTVGASSLPFVAVIKSEVQDGFRRRKDGGVSVTEFVNDLFLTRAQRLYKIGIFIRLNQKDPLPSNWRAFVFDHNMTERNREAAAQYFYEGFLGCRFMEDSAYETARFFELTKDFVIKNVPDRELRHDLNDALYSFVKTEQSPTFTAAEFAERNLSPDLLAKYESFLDTKKFPKRAIKRDIETLKGKLKKRRFRYGPDIEFLVSPEALQDGRAKIETITGDGLGSEERPTTLITIRASYTSES